MKNTKLQFARERARLTQTQVAKQAGVTERAYQFYEAGRKKPRVDTAIRIADALGTTVEEIFKGEENR